MPLHDRNWLDDRNYIYGRTIIVEYMRCLVALLFLSGVLAGQTAKPEQKGTIHGVVKDTTGAPIAGITVAASYGPGFGTRTLALPNGQTVTASERAANAITDEAGSYAFAALAPGIYSLRTARDPATETVKLDAGQEVKVDFVIPPNPTISGHVVDQNKDPVVDGFVWLLKPEYRNGVLKQAVIGPRVTNEDGSYSFDTDLEVNRRYYILVDRPPAAGLTAREPIEVPTYYPSASRMDDANAVILQPGESRDHVDIRIASAPFHCVDGKIQSAGKPAPEDFAVFETPLAGTRLPRLRSSAGNDGKYHFCGLPSGSYQLSTPQGLTDFTVAGSDVQHVDLSLDMAYPNVQVDWDGQPASHDFPKLGSQASETLRKIAAAMGMGDNPREDDLQKLALRLFDPALHDALAKLRSDPDFPREMGNLMGSLLPLGTSENVILSGIENEFGGPIRGKVPAGDYFVNVVLPQGSYVKEMTFNNLNITGGALHLAPAASGTLHVLMARGTAELAVAVADSEGKPVPNATVIVVPGSVTSVPALSRTHTFGHTDQNGNFTAKSLAPGKYRVIAIQQTVRWDVREDLEKVLVVMFQANDVELDAKASAQIALAPIPIY
jgi:protocatechuate 3,4-dioxygenase beta subunit